MSSVLDKPAVIVELVKAGNFRQDISMKLKVNRMLVWKTLKRYEETGDIQNIPEQGQPRTARTPKLVKATKEKIRRNPKRSIHNLAKESNVSYGILSTVLRKGLMMSPFKHVKKRKFSAQIVDKRSRDARFFFPANKIVRCQTSFSVMRRNSMLNTTFTSKISSLIKEWR